jgi:hypothetical protein
MLLLINLNMTSEIVINVLNRLCAGWSPLEFHVPGCRFSKSYVEVNTHVPTRNKIFISVNVRIVIYSRLCIKQNLFYHP